MAEAGTAGGGRPLAPLHISDGPAAAKPRKQDYITQVLSCLPWKGTFEGTVGKQRWTTHFQWSMPWMAFHFGVEMSYLAWATVRLAHLSEQYTREGPLMGLTPSAILPGFQQDLSDHQWRNARKSLPLLLLVAVAHVTLGSILTALCSRKSRIAAVRLQLLFGVIATVVLHGTYALCVWAMLVVGYCISFIPATVNSPWGRGPKRWHFGTIVVWCFAVGTLLLKNSLNRFRFRWLSYEISFLDDHTGVYRWQLTIGFVMLRIISFCTDRSRMAAAMDSLPSSPTSPPTTPPAASDLHPTHKQRCDTHLDQHLYCFVNFAAYALYLPLYLAGPIMSYNAWMSQQLKPPRYSLTYNCIYFLKLLVALFSIELMSHFLYVNAIFSIDANRFLWNNMNALELFSAGLFTLIFFWLKFVVLWRFFRMWALFDGIDAPENMLRFIVNNYSIFEFWKTWHASFNLWLLQYLYIPLGGNRHMMLRNVFCVFAFVAIWHEVEWRLLTWGIATCSLLIPEVVCTAKLSSPDIFPWFIQRRWKHVCAVAGAINVHIMVLCNLLGFSAGPDGSLTFVQQSYAWALPLTLFIVFNSTHVMFFIRVYEALKGNKKRSRSGGSVTM